MKFFVKDTGIGISKEQQKNIFKRFTKIETDIKKLYRGAGLGLAISKGLVDLLGGKIWLKSKINYGSEFYFTIPCDEISEEGNLINEKSNLTTDYNWSDKTILITEDEDSNFSYLKLLLTNTKINILRAKDGKEAVDICQKNKIDLILMDIKMPGMDGVEATSIIKKLLPDIPVIVQSAYLASADFTFTTRNIFNDIIEKPISDTKILSMISKYL
jgi:CheY-like chemotaxis protein